MQACAVPAESCLAARAIFQAWIGADTVPLLSFQRQAWLLAMLGVAKIKDEFMGEAIVQELESSEAEATVAHNFQEVYQVGVCCLLQPMLGCCADAAAI